MGRRRETVALVALPPVLELASLSIASAVRRTCLSTRAEEAVWRVASSFSWSEMVSTASVSSSTFLLVFSMAAPVAVMNWLTRVVRSLICSSSVGPVSLRQQWIRVRQS